MDPDTVAVYEARASDWQARRPARRSEDAVAFRESLGRHDVRVDLGCGAAVYTPELGEPVVALDAARAMLDLVPARASRAWRVQADLEALPFRRSALAGAWARASYLHVPRTDLPMALAQLHWACRVGAPVYLALRHGDLEGPRPGDEFPGRFFAEWRREPLFDVVTGAGFTIERDEVTDDWLFLWARRRRTLPDTVGAGMRLLVCGLNPSEYAADAGVGFARPGNRFWPAALEAGLVTRDRDPLDALRHHRVGMTDLVKRATPNASALTVQDYRDGAARVERLVRRLRPGAICFVGLSGWRAAVDPHASAGVQAVGFGDVPAYVMPSTSGANAHARVADLVDHLCAAATLSDTGCSRP